jgi:hypothetical protein
MHQIFKPALFNFPVRLGHLDRVLHGICGEEVLHACDENVAATSSASAGGDSGLANPAVHFFRGLRSRNLSAIRHATQVRIILQLTHTELTLLYTFLERSASTAAAAPSLQPPRRSGRQK